MADKKPSPLEEAKALLMAEEKIKQDKCSKELSEVLEKHGYTLQPVTQISLVQK